MEYTGIPRQQAYINPNQSANYPLHAGQYGAPQYGPMHPSQLPKVKSVKHLECWYWRTGQCKYLEHNCLYAHHYTGHMAEAPKAVEPGRESIKSMCHFFKDETNRLDIGPAVAGANAKSMQPVYHDWRTALRHPTADSTSTIAINYQGGPQMMIGQQPMPTVPTVNIPVKMLTACRIGLENSVTLLKDCEVLLKKGNNVAMASSDTILSVARILDQSPTDARQQAKRLANTANTMMDFGYNLQELGKQVEQGLAQVKEELLNVGAEKLVRNW
ncbi:hypothetical protein MMC06_002481 [Schaereria dolodes]|nr:hypothetical protein [Schaereria dolodes]